MKFKKGHKPIEAIETDNSIAIPIKIGKEQWYITCDRYNFILGKKKTNKVKGKDMDSYTLKASFYSSLEALMTDLYTRRLKNMDAKTLNQLQNNILKAKEDVKGLYAELTQEEL